MAIDCDGSSCGRLATTAAGRTRHEPPSAALRPGSVPLRSADAGSCPKVDQSTLNSQKRHSARVDRLSSRNATGIPRCPRRRKCGSPCVPRLQGRGGLTMALRTALGAPVACLCGRSGLRATSAQVGALHPLSRTTQPPSPAAPQPSHRPRVSVSFGGRCRVHVVNRHRASMRRGRLTSSSPHRKIERCLLLYFIQKRNNEIFVW